MSTFVNPEQRAHATPRVEGGAASDGGAGTSLLLATWADTNLLAQSLNVNLGQLFTVHQTLDPAVERGDGGWFERRRREVCGSAPDVFHIRIHVLQAIESEIIPESARRIDSDVGGAGVW